MKCIGRSIIGDESEFDVDINLQITVVHILYSVILRVGNVRD